MHEWVCVWCVFWWWWCMGGGVLECLKIKRSLKCLEDEVFTSTICMPQIIDLSNMPSSDIHFVLLDASLARRLIFS